jgi:hypothetical protein
MLNFLLILVLAHLLGDFVFQPDSWVKHKRQKLSRSIYLYLHILVHFSLLMLLLQFQSKYFFEIFVITLSHFLIDVAKLYLEQKFKSKVWFFIDQLLHYSIIAIVVKSYFYYQLSIEKLYATSTLLLLVCIKLLTYVLAILLKIILAKWDFRTIAQKTRPIVQVLTSVFSKNFLFSPSYASISGQELYFCSSQNQFLDLAISKNLKTLSSLNIY